MAVSKGPLNYTTSVSASKTAHECIDRLAQHGVRRIMQSYDDRGHVNGLAFEIETRWGWRQYELPVNVAGVHKVLYRAWDDGKIKRIYTSMDQAERTAWRVLKDWLEAQLALIEAGVSELSEIMLPWMRIDQNTTLYQQIDQNQMRAIES